ncbi:MAG: M48 family metallopeptidase [Methyloligellaceae bacterium]
MIREFQVQGAIMTDQDIKALLHPKESKYYILSLVALTPIALLLSALVIGTFGGVLLFFGFAYLTIWFVQKMIRTWYLAHCARVDEHNFPGVHNIVMDVKSQLGYDQPVDAFVVEEGSFNCSLMPFFNRKILIINSGLLDEGVSTVELKWIIARFIGSLRAKSYRLSIVQALISTSEKLLIFNIFLYPYERAIVMSGDRLGLAAIGGDITSAISAMNRLCVGARCSSLVSLTGIAKQENDIKGFFGFLVRVLSSHPPLVHRYREILRFANESYPHRLKDFGGNLVGNVQRADYHQQQAA